MIARRRIAPIALGILACSLPLAGTPAVADDLRMPLYVPVQSALVYCHDADHDSIYLADPRCNSGDRQISYEEYLSRGGRPMVSPAPKGAAPQASGKSLPPKGGKELPPKGADTVPTAMPPEPEDTGSPWDGLEIVASGTGFYVDAKGHLLTNAHVVEDCRAVGVLGESGAVAPTRPLRVDPDLDLAVLEAEAVGKPFAAFRSTGAEIGEPAYAIGFPLLGMLTSINMTNGIVSSLTGPGGDESLVQTTAPVQPGNSGGPLVDEAGNVIGVVVAMADLSIAQNIGWAIRGDVALRFLNATGIRPTLTEPLAPVSTREVAKSVVAYTVPLLCYQ
jgi:S1-C subfamily serine protease